MTATADEKHVPRFFCSQEQEGVARLRFAGDWRMTGAAIPESADVLAALEQSGNCQRLEVEMSEVGEWDTSLVSVLYALIRKASDAGMECRWKGVPDGVENLLTMALRRKPVAAASGEGEKGIAQRLGERVFEGRAATERVMNFIGEVTLSLGRWLKGGAYFRKVDFLDALHEAGPKALPIVTLISFLVGLILAFVGAMQLRQFGAQVFVANLVGIAMAREMGGMMTGIIMAGRTGASYAARLGTMQVNEEVDALRTTGVNPMDFLTLPRILALLLMVPLLTVYSMALGILGGMSIGVFMLDLSATEYWRQTVSAVPLVHFWAGLIKSVVFAFVIGIAGCYHGLRGGRSSESVGRVTTMAVVSAIVFIILTDSLLTVVYDAIGF